jgi:hypothetical protein
LKLHAEVVGWILKIKDVEIPVNIFFTNMEGEIYKGKFSLVLI